MYSSNNTTSNSEGYNEKNRHQKGNFEDKLKQWHSSLREKLNKTGQSKPSYDKNGEVFNQTVPLMWIRFH